MDINQDIILNNDQGIEIKLGGAKGGIAIIDTEDFDKVSQYKWYKDKGNYATGKVGFMHRFIMSPPEDKFIDHINHNRLDNRKSNLRETTIFINNANKSKAKNKSSQYKNVYYDKRSKKFMAQISMNGKTISLGSSENEIDTAKLVDMYIVHNKLDHIELKFPENKEAYLKEMYIRSFEVFKNI
jgi:hypothetical protein